MKSALLGLILIFSIVMIAPALADVSKNIAVQGRLANTVGELLTGTYSVNFSIWNASDAGTMLWSGLSTVIATKGLFNATLEPNLAFDHDYWLQIRIGTETLSPRQRLTPAPAALWANVARDLLGGILTTTANGVGVGIAVPQARLHIATGGGACTGTANCGAITSSTVCSDQTGGICAWSAGTCILASGKNCANATTQDACSAVSGCSWQLSLKAEGDAIFLGNVGIGTTSPSTKLHVIGTSILGNVNVTGDFFVSKIQGTTSAAGHLFLNPGTVGGSIFLNTAAGQNVILISNASNVGIGTIAPSERLVVNGSLLVNNAVGDALLFVNATSGNVGISTATPSEKLHVNGSFRIDNTTGSAILFVNNTSGNVGIGTTTPTAKFEVAGNISATAFGKTSCPTDMFMVGTAGSPTAFCVESTERAGLYWWNATVACRNATRRLCSAEEWYLGCISGTGTNWTNNWEWISDFVGGGNPVVSGNANCKSVDYNAPAANLPYRCCQ